MEEKKLHIIKNVSLMYQKFGIRNVTMDDVAAEFGISKKTLYQYFSDKADMVSHVVDYFLENRDVHFRTKEAENAIDNLFAIREHLAHIFKVYNNNLELDLKKTYPLLYKKVREKKRQRILENSIDNLNQGINQGLYRKNIDPYFIAKLQVGRMLFTMNPDYGIFEEYEVNSLAFFDSMLNYHMYAICTQKGLEYYKTQLNKVQHENKN
jgi:AcrR family transcriptional regulator